MRKFIFLFVVIIAGASITFVSCKKQKNNENSNVSDIPMGFVGGRVLAVNGTTPISNANIFVDAGGEVYFTNSDRNGNFVLSAPIGEQVLNIQTGSGKIFRSQYNVTIKEGQTTFVPAGTLKLLQVTNLAYIAGYWDNIQTVVIDSLGYTCDELTVADLADVNTLLNYGGLFLNCGKNGDLDSNMYENLKTFVESGGSIYASDFAVEYLTGDNHFKGNGHIHDGFHQKSCTSLAGGIVPDTSLCTMKQGPQCIESQAQVVAPDLLTYLGVSNFDVEYDLANWEVIQVLTFPWEVLVTDPVTYGPLAIRMQANGRNLEVKSLNTTLDQSWVTICHIPPGNPGNAHTITINSNALAAHLAHGDYLGDCLSGGTSGGTIYFTTFHNKVQGTVSQDVQHMLEYFILNL